MHLSSHLCCHSSSTSPLHQLCKPALPKPSFPFSAPLWLADLGAARIDQRQTGCYSSYVGMPAWPNKLGETIPSKREPQASLVWVARSVKLPELSGLWPGLISGGRLQADTHSHTHRCKSPLSNMGSQSFPWHLSLTLLGLCCWCLYAFDLVSPQSTCTLCLWRLSASY